MLVGLHPDTSTIPMDAKNVTILHQMLATNASEMSEKFETQLVWRREQELRMIRDALSGIPEQDLKLN